MRDAMLFIHFLGLALGIGSGFANLFIASANKNLTNEERAKFMFRLRALGHMGMTGIILLIISGGYLATPYYSIITSMPLFIAKLSLVFVLLIIVILIDRQWRKALKSGDGRDLAPLPKLGRLAFPVGMLILILAVLQFH